MQTFNNEILDILRDLKHNNPHVTLRNISYFLDGVDAYFFNCELKEIRAGKSIKPGTGYSCLWLKHQTNFHKLHLLGKYIIKYN